MEKDYVLDLVGRIALLNAEDRKSVLSYFCRICGDKLESGDWTGLNYCLTCSPDPR